MRWYSRCASGDEQHTSSKHHLEQGYNYLLDRPIKSMQALIRVEKKINVSGYNINLSRSLSSTSWGGVYCCRDAGEAHSIQNINENMVLSLAAN